MGDILSVAQHKCRITFTVHCHENLNPLHGDSHFRKEFHHFTREAKAKKPHNIKREVSFYTHTHTHTNIRINTWAK
jgi:hypothetical protein